MSAIAHLFLAVVFIHCMVGFFNYGATMAYMTRNHLRPQPGFARIFRVYLSATIAASVGVFAFPGCFATVAWPRYGWKLWHGEIRSSKNKWYMLLIEKIAEERRKAEWEARRQTRADGMCASIWE